MDKKMIVFGDLHLDAQRAEVTLAEARRLGIEVALNLGDEDSFSGSGQEIYDRLFGALRDYRDEGNELICCVGDKTGGVKYITDCYVGFDPEGERTGSIIFRRGNVIAGHDGRDILKEHGDMINNYEGEDPLVIFHGHLHSIGYTLRYRWLREEEKRYEVYRGSRTLHLKPGKVYWVHPGGPFNLAAEMERANFAIYDPKEQTVTLRTILFKKDT